MRNGCKHKLPGFCTLLLFPLLLQAQKVSLSEKIQEIKTYPFSDPNPLPSMAISNKVSPFYPYYMIDGYTDKGIEKPWKVVTLANKYITVTVLPQVGGKVWGAVENSTGKEFVYLNHVMKFRAIGIRGPWTSGGIEHNFGLDLGHAPWAAAPVDYALVHNPDGSAACIVGGLDLASRSEWRVKINLPEDKAYFETEALWFNPLPLHDAYLSWENAAFRASNDLRFYFPGNYHIGHDGLAKPWPIDSKGRNISFYRNNTFGGSKSYHVVGNYRNWYGGYWENSSFGFGHWSRYSDDAGKKLWIWSLARDGAIWKDLLTDNDGQYIEAQAGVKLNQAAERSGYHSPFRQLTLKPLYSETKTDYWFPVKETGGMVDANRYGTLNVSRSGDTLSVHISPLQSLDDSLVITVNEAEVSGEKIHLEPMKTFSKKIIFRGSYKLLTVNFGNKKLFYTSKPESIDTRPVVTGKDIKDFNSAERFLRMAQDQNSMRNYAEAMGLYKKCLEKEPTNTGALAGMAELYYRQGQYEKGVSFARKVLEVSTYDGAANFIYGVLEEKLDKLDDAEEALSIASLTMEFRSAAFSEIAGIELLKKNFEEAVTYASKALDFNKFNLNAAGYLVAAYRKLNDQKHFAMSLEALLKIDPLNQFGRFEKYLASPDSAMAAREYNAGIQNEFPQETLLENAIRYVSIGMNKEAVKMLEMAPDYPTVNYWLAYLSRNTNLYESKKYLQKAINHSPKLVFPFRPETEKVLNWAQQQQPSWKNLYYLGLIKWNHGDTEKATQLFLACGNQPDYGPFYITRGILLSGDQARRSNVLADYRKAINIDPSEWRGWHALSAFYRSSGNFSKEYENAKIAFYEFSSNPVISIDYAKALLDVQKPEECINVLKTTLVLPQEGAREGHQIFENANILIALDKILKHKYKEAVKFLEQAKEFPENLGSGKPYEPDYRLEDYLLAFCRMRMGDRGKALEDEKKIITYSLDPAHFNEGNTSNNYISLVTFNKFGKKEQAAALISDWKHFTDSLSVWHISGMKQNTQMKWVLAKYNQNDQQLAAIEKELKTGGEINNFTLLLRAVFIIEQSKSNNGN